MNMLNASTKLKRRFARHRAVLVFGSIGVANTLLHSATVVLLVEGVRVAPVAANVAGFAVANTASYFANCRFTFRQVPSWGRYRKFFTVSLLSLALTILLSGFAEAQHWHYLVGLMMVLLCGPVLTYLLHKTFTFRKTAP